MLCALWGYDNLQEGSGGRMALAKDVTYDLSKVG
jgi:hypothetical protein